MGMLRSIAAAARNAIRTMADVARTAGRFKKKGAFLRRHLKRYAFIAFLLFYLFYAVVIQINGATVSFGELFQFSDSYSTQIFNDATAQYQYLTDTGLELTEYNAVFMDNKTVGRILKAVANYNEEVSEVTNITYEYKTYEGKGLSFDEVTGKVDIDIEAEQTAPKSTDEEESSNIMTESFSGQSQEQEGSGGNTVKETISLNRMSVDADPDHFGENVFYLRWQPVFVLCAMYVQNNVELMGTYNEYDEDGESYYLSDSDIERIIDVFAFKYSFYDDCTVDKKHEISFDRILKESSGYKLVTDLVMNELDESTMLLTIKRVPAIAPKHIYNAYLTYDYEYEEQENGYFKLVSRSCRLEPDNLLAACEELIPEFDKELFLEEMSNLPDSRELVEYYASLFEGGAKEYRTFSQEECPAIGMYVSTVTGFTARLFHRNSASDSIAGNVSDGANVLNHQYDISVDAQTDAEFKAMYEVTQGCIGTKYIFGSNGGPGVSFDCSSFVSYVLRECGYQVQRETTLSLWAYCVPVEIDVVRPGDIIFFQGTYRKGISHVGIWLGNNKFIHASSGAGEVVISEYKTGGYYDQHFYGFGRLPEKSN